MTFGRPSPAFAMVLTLTLGTKGQASPQNENVRQEVLDAWAKALVQVESGEIQTHEEYHRSVNGGPLRLITKRGRHWEFNRHGLLLLYEEEGFDDPSQSPRTEPELS